MALKIRLSRGGAKKRPYYRIVVADARSPREGKFLERVGTYNPMLTQEHPQRITLIQERIQHWMAMGAQPTDRVAKFLGSAGIIAAPAVRETPLQSAPKKKAQDRLKAEAAAKEAAVEGAAKAVRDAAEAAAAAAAPAPVPSEPELTEEAPAEASEATSA